MWGLGMEYDIIYGWEAFEDLIHSWREGHTRVATFFFVFSALGFVCAYSLWEGRGG